MDSLTQIVLGAAVGEAVAGRKLGNWALLLGAIAGTLPDLDVLATWGSSDQIRQLQIHRAYSHSMFTHILAAFPLAWISILAAKNRGYLKRLNFRQRVYAYPWLRITQTMDRANMGWKKWYLFWFLGLFTHALLDCGTTYGTRLFLPFTKYQVAFNNVSVIDPLYTLPFLVLLILMMCYRRGSDKRKKWFKIAWIVSSTYMLLTFGLKFGVHQKFKNTLVEQGKSFTELNSTPTILNAILWSGIAYDKDSLHVAEYSYLRNDIPIHWISFARNLDQMERYDCEALETMAWFGDGNYFVEPLSEDSMRFYTTKFGRMRLDTEVASETFMFYATFKKSADGSIEYKSMNPRDNDEDGEVMKAYFFQLLDRIGIYSVK